MSVSPVDNSNNPLVSLPDEIKVHIVSFLSGVDFTHLTRTCHVFNHFLQEENLWRAETERTFDITCIPESDTWKQKYLSLTKAALKDVLRIVGPHVPPQALINNKTFILQAVKQSGCALEHASEELRNDRDIVLEAVKQKNYALEYASKELRNDRDIVLEAVKQAGYALRYASEELRNDRDIVLEAVKQNGYALEYASEELRNDREFVLEAVKQDGWALQYASKELRNDRDIVLEAEKAKDKES